MLKVGVEAFIVRRWFITSLGGASQELTSGTAYFRAFVRDQTVGTRLYLQGDGTLDTAEHQFAMSYTAGLGWVGFIDPSLNLKGLNVTIESIHDDARVAPLAEDHYVVEADTDDINTAITGIDNLSELVFDP